MIKLKDENKEMIDQLQNINSEKEESINQLNKMIANKQL
jgi:hypothetical protein